MDRAFIHDTDSKMSIESPIQRTTEIHELSTRRDDLPGKQPAIVDLAIWKNPSVDAPERTAGARVRNKHGAVIRELLFPLLSPSICAKVLS